MIYWQLLLIAGHVIGAASMYFSEIKRSSRPKRHMTDFAAYMALGAGVSFIFFGGGYGVVAIIVTVIAFARASKDEEIIIAQENLDNEERDRIAAQRDREMQEKMDRALEEKERKKRIKKEEQRKKEVERVAREKREEQERLVAEAELVRMREQAEKEKNDRKRKSKLQTLLSSSRALKSSPDSMAMIQTIDDELSEISSSDPSFFDQSDRDNILDSIEIIRQSGVDDVALKRRMGEVEEKFRKISS